jgi:hypothetical protein
MCRAPAQPRQPFGDVGVGKEGRALTFGGDQFVKLLDPVADMNVNRIALVGFLR